MAYFIVQMRDDNKWVLVPKRWMSQCHKMFFHPHTRNWKDVAMLDERSDEEHNPNFIRCYIHDDMTTADNLEDGLKKLARKCPRPKPPNQPQPSVDHRAARSATVRNIAPATEASLSMPAKKKETLETLETLLRSQSLPYPLKKPEDLQRLNTLLKDNNFCLKFKKLSTQIDGQDTKDRAWARLSGLISRELAVQVNPIRHMSKKDSIWNQTELMTVYIELYPVEGHRQHEFRCLLEQWHRVATA